MAESVQDTYEVSTKESVPPWQRKKALRTVAVYLSFAMVGVAYAILGPSLVSLQILLDSSTKYIAWGFTGNALGYLCGAIFCGVVYDRLNKELLFFLSLMVGGAATIMIPYSLNLIMYIMAMIIFGFSMAFIDTGAQSYIFKLWEKHKFMPAVMQALHSMWSVGSALGPFIIKPFLADILNSANQTNTETVSQQPQPVGQSNNDDLKDDVASIRIGFLITAILLFVTAIVFFVAFCIVGASCMEKHRKRLKKPAKSEETAPESSDTKRFRIRLLVITSVYYFFFIWIEGLPGNFLATFVVTGLGWENESGALITAVYWGAHGLGRVFGIPLSMCMRPGQMVVTDLVTTTIGFSLLFFISYHISIIWIATAIAGVGVGTLFASALLYVEQYIEVTGRASSIVVASCSVGGMTSPLLTGYLMDLFTHMSLVYICLSATITEVLVFVGMAVYSHKYGILRRQEESSENSAPKEDPVEMNPLNEGDSLSQRF